MQCMQYNAPLIQHVTSSWTTWLSKSYTEVKICLTPLESAIFSAYSLFYLHFLMLSCCSYCFSYILLRFCVSIDLCCIGAFIGLFGPQCCSVLFLLTLCANTCVHMLKVRCTMFKCRFWSIVKKIVTFVLNTGCCIASLVVMLAQSASKCT